MRLRPFVPKFDRRDSGMIAHLIRAVVGFALASRPVLTHLATGFSRLVNAKWKIGRTTPKMVGVYRCCAPYLNRCIRLTTEPFYLAGLLDNRKPEPLRASLELGSVAIAAKNNS